MSFNSEGPSNNHVSHSATEDIALAAGNNGSHWTCLPQPFHNYAQYLSEASAYLPNATTQNVIASSFSPIANLHTVNAINGTNRNFLPPDSSTDIDSNKSQASWTAESSRGNKRPVPQLNPRLTVGAPGLLKPRSSSSKKKTHATDRQRRKRIADNFRALHDLLPTPVEGSQAYVVDDVIDYVKYLQLQIKELSGSRLRGESIATPLTFREGYGHYINRQLLNEPLEEMMGKLLEEHPEEAAQLLQRKGLFLMPMPVVDDFQRAIQTFGGIPRV